MWVCAFVSPGKTARSGIYGSLFGELPTVLQSCGTVSLSCQQGEDSNFSTFSPTLLIVISPDLQVRKLRHGVGKVSHRTEEQRSRIPTPCTYETSPLSKAQTRVKQTVAPSVQNLRWHSLSGAYLASA